MSAQRPRQAKSRQNQKARQQAQKANNTQPATPKVETPEKKEDEEPEEITCLTCVEPITCFAISEDCTHRELCGKCSLRLRVLYKKTGCVLCKADQKSVLFTKNQQTDFNSFKDKLSTLPKMEPNIYFESKALFDEYQKLFEVKCPECGIVYQEKNQLTQHLRDKHKKQHCYVCVEYLPKFLDEHPVFTDQELKAHITGKPNSDDNSNDAGHPECKFCDRAFFSSDILWEHMETTHESCFICRQNPQTKYEYFENYRHLGKHYKNKHFVCTEPSCMAERDIVFASDIELQSHRIAVHLPALKLSQAQEKRARVITIDYDFGPPANNNTSGGRNNNNGGRNNNNRRNQRGGAQSNPNIRNRENERERERREEERKKEEPEPEKLLEPEIVNIDFPAYPNNPNDLKERNQQLIKRIKSVLNNDNFSVFKNTSLEYKDGKITGEQYHSRVINTFGEQNAEILLELIALLPDESKRAALMHIHTLWVHQQRLNQFIHNSSSPPATNSIHSQSDTSLNRSAAAPATTNRNQILAQDSRTPVALEPKEEFPSLVANQAPRTPLASAAVYSNRVRSNPTVNDFPTLTPNAPTPAPPPGSAWNQGEQTSAPSSGRNKGKKQRQKAVLFKIG